MSLPLLTRHLVEKKLTTYCRQTIPVHARYQARLAFEIDGSKVTMIEERDAYSQPGIWAQMPIAQFLLRRIPRTSCVYPGAENAHA